MKPWHARNAERSQPSRAHSVGRVVRLLASLIGRLGLNWQRWLLVVVETEEAMRVLVTGGHGFIGSRVVARLLEEGHQPRCLVRSTSDTSRIDGMDVEKVVGDVRDAESIRRALETCEGVLHLASPSSWNDINSPAMHDTVVEGTRFILEAARAAGGLPVVYCSSIIALGGAPEPLTMDEAYQASLADPSMIYAHTKLQAEGLCMEAAAAGGHVVIVNPSEVYGPEDIAMVTAGNLVDFATSTPVFVVHGGTSIAHVDDIAAGIVAALFRGRSGERYLLGGDNLSVKELAERTLKLLDRKAPIVTVPTPVIRWIADVAPKLRIPLPFNPQVIPYAVRYWFVDNRKAKDELGVAFRPADEVLAPTLDWLKQSGKIR